jgi:mono/diheme cytochrome c family protein
LSCHTTRYITTQPPLTAAKWEESVRKMMKTYAAPIAEEQVQPIVQYLMATKEKGPAESWETPAVIVASKSELISAAMKSDGSMDLKRGASLYALNCASCHGADGKAQSPAAIAQNMLPRPTDLTSGQWSAELVASAIVHGVPGTAMPAVLKISGDELRDLTAYTRGFAPAAEPSAVSASTDETKALFAKNCVSCHGVAGLGDGPAAPPLARPPANFRIRQPSSAEAVRVIADGVPGTAMPAWKSKLSDAQRAALAEYVRSFYVRENIAPPR